jgi:Flp pilus assembly protein TadG
MNETTRHAHRTTRGAVTVELALTIPILFTMVFASIEFGRAFLILNTAENAAYEGARRGIVPGATAADCQTVARQVIGAVGTQNVTVQVDPATIQLNTPEVEVTVSVPVDGNGYMFPIFLSGRTLVGKCRLTREKFDQTSTP